MKLGRSIVGILLSLSLTASLPSYAAERTCVESFRNAKEKFEARLAQLESQQHMAWIGAAFGVAAGVVCLRTKVLGKIARGVCAGAFGGIPLVAGYGVDSSSRARMARLHDSYRLYTIYQASQSPDPSQSREAQKMLSELGVDKQKERKALEEFATLMDYGKLCDGEMPRTYEETLGLMRDRLHAAQ